MAKSRDFKQMLGFESCFCYLTLSMLLNTPCLNFRNLTLTFTTKGWSIPNYMSIWYLALYLVQGKCSECDIRIVSIITLVIQILVFNVHCCFRLIILPLTIIYYSSGWCVVFIKSAFLPELWDVKLGCDSTHFWRNSKTLAFSLSRHCLAGGKNEEIPFYLPSLLFPSRPPTHS